MDLVALLKERLEQEIQAIITLGKVAVSGCWIVLYLARGLNGAYWYYQLQATDPRFLTKDLGKAGSKTYLDA